MDNGAYQQSQKRQKVFKNLITKNPLRDKG